MVLSGIMSKAHNKQILSPAEKRGLRRQPAAWLSVLNLGVNVRFSLFALSLRILAQSEHPFWF
jgi:hypothetical protein